MTLFDLDIPEATESYKSLLAQDRAEDRARLDEMYARAAPYLDDNFKDQFARCTDDRFFELRTAITLLDIGWELLPAKEGQPDFGRKLPDGRTLWIECITPSWGAENNPDKPPKLERGFQPAPVREWLLRHTAAMKEKGEKFRGYIEAGTVDPNDCCVVAINSGKLWPHVDGAGLPRIVSAVLPFGDEVITLDRKTLEVVDASHERRDELLNARKSPVATTAFLNPDAYGHISAVLHDTARISTWNGDAQAGRWVLVHNPTSNAELPADEWILGRRYRLIEEADIYRLIEETQGGAAPGSVSGT